MESFKGSARSKKGNSTKQKRASRLFHPRTQIEEAQDQIGEITDIMRQNMQNVIERDIKLSELDDRMINVTEKAKLFQMTAKKVKEKTLKEKIKMIIVTILVLVAVFGAVGFTCWLIFSE